MPTLQPDDLVYNQTLVFWIQSARLFCCPSTLEKSALLASLGTSAQAHVWSLVVSLCTEIQVWSVLIYVPSGTCIANRGARIVLSALHMYMHVCMLMYVIAHIYIHMYTCMYMSIYMYMCICMSVCMYVYIHVRICTIHTYIFTYVIYDLCAYIPLRAYTCRHISTELPEASGILQGASVIVSLMVPPF